METGSGTERKEKMRMTEQEAGEHFGERLTGNVRGYNKMTGKGIIRTRQGKDVFLNSRHLYKIEKKIIIGCEVSFRTATYNHIVCATDIVVQDPYPSGIRTLSVLNFRIPVRSIYKFVFSDGYLYIRTGKGEYRFKRSGDALAGDQRGIDDLYRKLRLIASGDPAASEIGIRNIKIKGEKVVTGI